MPNNVSSQPFWRSILFVPVLVDRFVQKAPMVGADALMLDLEDSIAPNQKSAARAVAGDIAKDYAAAGHDVFVRINRPWRLAVADLEATINPHITALTLPMVDSPEHVQEVAKVVDELERERGIPTGKIRFFLQVETAKGFTRINAIAAAHPRVAAIGLGSEDFATDLRIEPQAEILQMPKQLAVIAARAADVRPMGFIGSIARFNDTKALTRIMQRSRNFGFQGASCIHPNQVKVCNACFGPTTQEVEQAQQIVQAYEEALAKGVGAITVNGKMVDVPVWERAKILLELADTIAKRGLT